MWVCKQCGKAMSRDEVALYMRMVNRGASEFLCRECLAAFYGCEPTRMDEKIEQFKQIGCVLFSMDDPTKQPE